MKTSKQIIKDAMAVRPITIIEPAEQIETLNETVNAVCSVVNYIITDAFNLSSDESFWAGHQIGEALEPLRTYVPSAIMGAVQSELETGDYSSRMFLRLNKKSIPNDPIYTPAVKYAPVSDWTTSLCEIILSSYPDIRPMIASSIIGSVHGLLTELGIGDNPATSRPSMYLPNSVRYLLASNQITS